jgi:hypothetical protein
MLVDDASTGRRIPAVALVARSGTMRTWGLGPDLRTIAADLDAARSIPGLVPVLRLVTRTGREMRAVPGQSLRTVRGWAPIESIRCDERIAVARTLPPPEVPDDLGVEEAEILGMLAARPLGRANDASGAALFRCKDPDVVAALGDLMLAVHGQVTSIARRGEARIGLRVTDDLRGWACREAPVEEVPVRAYGAGDAALARFLGGFWSASGSAGTEERRPSAELRGLSAAQVAGLQHLLLRVGVLAVARASRGDDDGMPSVLLVSGTDPLGALGALPLRGEFAASMARVLADPSRLKDADLDYLPEEVTQALKRVSDGVLHGIHAHDAGGHGWELSRREYDEAIDALPASSSFRAWAGSAVLWDAVVSIETDGLAMCHEVRIRGAQGLLVNDIWVQG